MSLSSSRLWSLAALFFFVSTPLFARDYRLIDAMNEVLQRSEQLRIQRNEIETTRERIDDSVRNYFPDVSVTLREDGSLPEERQSAYEANLNQPLWAGGRLTGQYRQNRADLRSKRSEYQMIARDIIQRVIEAHFNVLRFKRTLEARRKELTQARKTFTITRQQRQNGNATELDLLNVRDQVNRIQVGLQQARNDLKRSKLRYNRLMKRNLTDTVTITSGRFSIRNDTPPPVTEQRIDRTTEELLRNSYRLKHLRAEVDYFEEGLDLAQSNYYPELSFVSNYNAAGGETFENKEYDYFLGVNLRMFFLGHSLQSSAGERRPGDDENYEENELTVSFFDNDPSAVQTDIDARSPSRSDESLTVQNQTARSRLDSARLRLKQARQEELNTLQSLFYQLETNRLNIVKNRTNLNFHDKKLDIMQRRRELGEAQSVDVLRATTQRFTARRNLIQSWYNYYQNKLKIDLAAGRIDVSLYPDDSEGIFW